MQSPATLALLATNILVSIAAWQNVRLVDAMIFDLSLIQRRHEYHRMITSGFIHADPMHLFANMVSLYFVGPPLESALQTWLFLGLYVACLVGGSAWTLMEHWREPNYRALGASGAVSGILAAFSLFAPLVLFFGFIPAIIYTVMFIAWSAFASGRVRDGIGHAAHLGGALTGAAIACLLWPQGVQAGWNQILSVMPF